MQGQNSSFARPQRRAFRPLARRDVIYTIMSDEPESSTVLPTRSSPFCCLASDLAAMRLAEIMSYDP